MWAQVGGARQRTYLQEGLHLRLHTDNGLLLCLPGQVTKWAIVWFCFCSPGSWKHLQLWGRWVCSHCQDRMPSSLGGFLRASAPLLELQLRTNERKSRISQFSLHPAGVQSDTRWMGKLPKEGRKNIKTWTQDKQWVRSEKYPDEVPWEQFSLPFSHFLILATWFCLSRTNLRHRVEAALQSLPWLERVSCLFMLSFLLCSSLICWFCPKTM